MWTTLRHIAALALLAPLTLGAGPVPDDGGNAEKSDTACLIEKAYNDIRNSIYETMEGARDAAHERYIIDRYVPAPPESSQPASERDDDEMWSPIEPDSTLPRHAVILVHGLDEVGTIWSDLAPRIHAERFTVLRYRYPNDARIAPSADHFASLLLELHDRGVKCVDLVAHSMGGLVSLEMLTRDGLYSSEAAGHEDLPDVRRLITVGTPFHGSPMAPLRGVTEFRESIDAIFDPDRAFAEGVLQFLYDGTGGAGEDLKPESEFLATLHARGLPTGVRITTIIGRMEPQGTQSWREGILTDGFIPDVIGKDRARSLLTFTEGASKTLGDGVVPLSSAKLEGVEDVVYHRADHRSLVKQLDAPGFVRSMVGAPEEPPAIDTIIERLREQCGCIQQ